MPFLARVEIHNADLPTYHRLHAAMEAECFKRVITGANDFKQYKMPLGTYWTDAFEDSWDAFNAAQRAALPIDATAQVILCGAGPILFQNCRQHVEQPILGLHSMREAEPRRPVPVARHVSQGDPSRAAQHNIPAAEPQRPAPKPMHIPQGEPDLAGRHNSSHTEPQRPMPRPTHTPQSEPTVAAKRNIPLAETHRPMPKSAHAPQGQPSLGGPQRISQRDPFATPPAPQQVQNGKGTLAGLRSLFQTDPETPPAPAPPPQARHARPALYSVDESDPYGSLPRLPMGALRGYGTR